MSRRRHAARTDTNQINIVDKLRDIPGCTVQPSMDDILVGYKGLNYWFEVKNPETLSPVTGKVQPSKIKPSQHKLVAEWQGQYNIVTSLDEILAIIGIGG